MPTQSAAWGRSSRHPKRVEDPRALPLKARAPSTETGGWEWSGRRDLPSSARERPGALRETPLEQALCGLPQVADLSGRSLQARGHWFEPSTAHPGQTTFFGRERRSETGEWERSGRSTPAAAFRSGSSNSSRSGTGDRPPYT